MSMPNQAPAHWSKDFVEHLRTVHFTLIALCVGLIVLASFPSKAEIQLAHEQVLEIVKVINDWDADLISRDIVKQQTELIKTFDRTNDFTFDNFGAETSNFIFVIHATKSEPARVIRPRISFSTDWTLKLNIPSELHDKNDANNSSTGMSVGETSIRTPPNLRLFAQLWDDLLTPGEVSFPQIAKSCIAAYVSGLDNDKVIRARCDVRPQPGTDNDNLRPLEFYRLEESGHSVPGRLNSDKPKDILSYMRSMGRDDYLGYFAAIQDDGAGYSVVAMPSSVLNSSKFDGHKLLTQRSPQWGNKYKLGFRDAFPELAAVDSAFETADIGSAERILQAEARRTGDAFEAAGLKIPAEVAVRCGVLLVLGVQLYMLIHLREFGNRLDREAGFEVAWIGVYTSNLARVLLIVSLLVLPACAVVMLSIRGLIMTEYKGLAWTALVTSNAASLALSYLIFKVLPQPPPPGLIAAEQPAPNSEQSESDGPVEQGFE
jgi:hypothetical protein